MKFQGYLDLLKEMIRQPSVVGSEHAFFRYLKRTLEERGAKVTWYEGLMVAQGEQPETAMFSAHIDRHGLVCTGPDEYQYAAFVAGGRSDLLGNSVSEQLMGKVADRFQDLPVWAYDPWAGSYYGNGQIANAYVCERRNNLVFNVEGLSHLVAGTPVAMQDSLRRQGGRLVGQLDNVLTAAALVHLFSLGFQGTAFFTAQEESGKSWRFLLEWFRRFGSSTHELIVVDTSPFPDVASADAQALVLRWRDANGAFSVRTTRRLEALCQGMGIAYVFKDRLVEEKNGLAEAAGRKPHSLGSTEMGRIVVASEGLVQGTTLQIPTTGYHTMEESASEHACRAFLSALMRLGAVA